MRTTTGEPVEHEQRRGGRQSTAAVGVVSPHARWREFFGDKAGATPGNTILMDANDSAKPIDLKGTNFDELLAMSNLYVGSPVPDCARGCA